MTDGKPVPGDQDEETGEPIEALADFGVPPSTGFLGRVRNSIHRRTLTGQVVQMSWFAPVLVFLEFLKMAFGLFESDNRKSGD